jgi:Ca2+-binding EF-hand superfamily protein
MSKYFGYTSKPPVRKSRMGNCESGGSGNIALQHNSSNFATPERQPLTDEQTNALRRIQKGVKTQKAINRAYTENQWKLFALADTVEENETMHMSAFMEKLIKLVPGCQDQAGIAKRESAKPVAQSALLDDIVLELDGGSAIESDTNGQRIYKFKGEVTPKIAHDILQLFRGYRPGRIDDSSLLRVLRNIYKKLKVKPNTNVINVQEQGTVTVVGDIHGQLTDLILILDEVGEPSPTNKILFNGDFVDRGANGLEVIALMFTYYCAFPDCVYMNRGNHEDPFVCANYGFQEEVIQKYNQQYFDLFAEIFRYIPLFSLINDQVFVVHGGLFTEPSVKLSDLNEIERFDYACVPPIKYPDNCEHGNHEQNRKELLKQLQRDALWSDPRKSKGLAKNERGAGVNFGPDITKGFMKNNHINMIIRSHECCKHGCDFPYAHHDLMDNYYEQEEPAPGSGSVRMTGSSTKSGKGNENGLIDPWYLMNIPLSRDMPLLCTLFSASNYCHGNNEGAYMTLKAIAVRDPVPPYANEISSTMHFVIHRYKTSAVYEFDSMGVSAASKRTALDLLLKKRRNLLMAFKEIDQSNTGLVSNEQWAKVMSKVTDLKIRWLAMISSIVPANCVPSPNCVKYMDFIQSLHSIKPSETQQTGVTDEVVQALYGSRRKVLETIFEYFDKDGDGEIDPTEFRIGCEKLNKTAAPADQLTDLDHILSVMDFNHSGAVDMNEFFEAFRNANIHTAV